MKCLLLSFSLFCQMINKYLKYKQRHMGGKVPRHPKISMGIPYDLYNNNIKKKNSGDFLLKVSFLIAPLSQKVTLKH